MSVAEVEFLRMELWDAGYRPVAVYNIDARHPHPGKAPFGDAWQNAARQDPPASVGDIRATALNTGILCDGLRAIDIDIEDAALVAKIRSMAIFSMGEAPMRTRDNSARCLLVYRAAEGEPRKRILSGKEGKVEVLGRGNQFVGFGKHPSGATLRWTPEHLQSIPRAALPAVTEQQISDFLEAVKPLIGASKETSESTIREDPEEVKELIARLQEMGASEIVGIDDLPEAVATKLAHAVSFWPGIARRWAGDFSDMAAAGKDHSRSAMDFSLAAILKRNAKLPLPDIAMCVLAYDFGCAHDEGKHPTAFLQIRYAARCAIRAGLDAEPSPTPADDEPKQEVSQETSAPTKPKKPSILHLEDVENLPPPEWLIDGLFPEGGLFVTYGAPKGGKTFIILSAGLHIAANREWFGRKVKSGCVVYIAGEGIGGLGTRLKAMRTLYKIPSNIPFFVIPRAVNFTKPDAASELVKLVRDTVGDEPIALVIIDTLARAMPGADENSAQEVGLVIAACDEIRQDLSCAVCPIHHQGKDATRGLRGTSAIHGAIDASFRVTKTGKTVAVKNEDQKEAECAPDLNFEMVEVAVGINRSSLVPVLMSSAPEGYGDMGDICLRCPDWGWRR